MSFKLSKEQSADRKALAAALRTRAAALNIAIAAFNRAVEPFAKAVIEVQNDYNEVLETARALANNIAEVAQEEFDAKSERWQDGERGVQVRSWIEQWQIVCTKSIWTCRRCSSTLTPTSTPANSRTPRQAPKS